MNKPIDFDSKKKVSIWVYVIIPGIAILLMVVFLNIIFYRLERKSFENAFKNEAKVMTTLISRRLQNSFSANEDTKAFFLSSEKIAENEFNRFVQTAIEVRKPLGIFLTMEWIDENNILRFVYPSDSDNSKIVVYDYNKYLNRLSPVLKAKETKLPVVTEPIVLGRGYPAILLYSPIYNQEEYQGVVASVIRLSDLFKPLSGMNQMTGYLKTDNLFVPFNEEVIYNSSGERIINLQEEKIKDLKSNKYLSLPSETESRETIIFADKKWEIVVYPNYFSKLNERALFYNLISIAAAGLMMLLLAVIYIRQKQLLKEKSLVEALFLGVGEGLVACDKNETIIYSNDLASDLIGYSKKELFGKKYSDYFKMVDSKGKLIAREKRLFIKAILNKKIIPISLIDNNFLLKKDGTKFSFAGTISPIIVDEKVEGIIVIFRNANKEKEIDRMKTEFLSLATHQLLTPVSSIKWMAELLLEDKELKEKQKSHVSDIYVSVERMRSLIKSLLNISRIESGRIMVEPKPTDLKDLVSELINELKNKIEEKKHIIKLKIDPRLKKVNIDSRLIREVYKNYLTNAIKYTPEKGKILIEIKIDKNKIISKVIDNGYGIPKAEQAKIFQKFYRATNIIDIENDGNGLGLYLVKQIVEVSGGKTGFESEANKGSVFWFTLPLKGSKIKKGEISVN